MKSIRMKVLPFTIPVAHDKTIIVQEDNMPFFYPHLHRHPEMQLTLILKGSGTLLAGNRIHSFGPNEIFFIGANIPHVFKSDPGYFAPKSKKIIHSITLFFNTKEKLASLFELSEFRQANAFFTQHHSGFKVPQSSFVRLSRCIAGVQYSSGLDQLIKFFELLTVLTTLENMEPLAYDISPKRFSDQEGIRISNIYNYVMRHYTRDISLEEVASIAYMTPPAFCRYFKKHTCLTFISFLNKVRINEACKKLIDGSGTSVASVAYDCGFNSVPNFNRVFKSAVGKSPREYTTEFLTNAS